MYFPTDCRNKRFFISKYSQKRKIFSEIFHYSFRSLSIQASSRFELKAHGSGQFIYWNAFKLFDLPLNWPEYIKSGNFKIMLWKPITVWKLLTLIHSLNFVDSILQKNTESIQEWSIENLYVNPIMHCFMLLFIAVYLPYLFLTILFFQKFSL